MEGWYYLIHGEGYQILPRIEAGFMEAEMPELILNLSRTLPMDRPEKIIPDTGNIWSKSI